MRIWPKVSIENRLLQQKLPHDKKSQGNTKISFTVRLFDSIQTILKDQSARMP
jgi:hypothetical protein